LRIFFIICIFFSSKSFAKLFQSYADIVARVVPGVVHIRTKSLQRPLPLAMMDLYRFFFPGQAIYRKIYQPLGSGIIVDQQGYILTNEHVIRGASQIDVIFQSKKKHHAKVIARDIRSDLALLKLSNTKNITISSIDFADSNLLRVGDIVLAIGNPFGYSQTVTSGIISSLEHGVGSGPFDRFLQTDAEINSGNSGGPLIDLRGRVVGMNTVIPRNKSMEKIEINFAIPSNHVKKILKDFRRYGKVIRPWLGIIGKDIPAQESGINGEEGKVYGVMIENLIIHGPADQKKLEIGDLLLEVDHKIIQNTHHLQKSLRKYKPHDKVLFKCYRQEKGAFQVKISLGETPKLENLSQERDTL